MTVEIYQFETNRRLAESLAECVASGLEGALNLRDYATLAVSGGSTPRPLSAAIRVMLASDLA